MRPEPAIAASRAVSIEVYATDGVRLRGKFWTRPDGNVIGPRLSYVLAHGFTLSSDRADVVRLAERLNGRGASVLVVDFRGHGASEGLTSIGVDEELDLRAGLDYLRDRGESTIAVLGWSMGASVAIRLGALDDARPPLAAVVSVSGPGLWYERGTRSMRRLHLGAETAAGRWVLRRLLRTRVGVDGWHVLPPSPVELAGRIAPTPLLVVHGDRDPYFPVRHAELLARAAPQAELWIERGMGHAESATSPELLDRIDAWVRRAITARSGTMDR